MIAVWLPVVIEAVIGRLCGSVPQSIHMHGAQTVSCSGLRSEVQMLCSVTHRASQEVGVGSSAIP